MNLRNRLLLAVLVAPTVLMGQSPSGGATASVSPTSPSAAMTLPQAVDRAQRYSAQFRTAITDAGLAKQDRVQARAALLPGATYTTGAYYTQPTHKEEVRAIAANGIREYVSQGTVQEDIGFSAVADYRRAHAAEALAKARLEVARRGLVATVTQNFYGALAARSKLENAVKANDEARHFLLITQELEQGGEVSRADTIKAQLQANDSLQALREARLAEQKARLDLAVLIFPTFTEEFELADDLALAPELPAVETVEGLAARNNPDLKAAAAALQAARMQVQAAQGGYLPSLSFGYTYGIDAPTYAIKSYGENNLGYQLFASVQFPLFNWGATQSRIRQATLQRTQAQVELSAAQRQALANLKTYYAEAASAKEQIETLRQSADIAADSLRLTTMRYQAGEATALEVVDAQNSLSQARNNFDDGEARYHVALAQLQTLTGGF